MFLFGTAGLPFFHSPNAAVAARRELNPSFDPSYSKLPTLEQQTQDLTAEALQAQTVGLTVLGHVLVAIAGALAVIEPLVDTGCDGDGLRLGPVGLG